LVNNLTTEISSPPPNEQVRLTHPQGVGDSVQCMPKENYANYTRLYGKETLENARSLRKNRTDAEGILWSFLATKQMEYKFRQQQPVGKYIADFVCDDKHLIIELDGDQHGEEKGLKHDVERTKFLEEQGYSVLRFWNNEIYDELEAVLDTIYWCLEDKEYLKELIDDRKNGMASLLNRTSPQTNSVCLTCPQGMDEKDSIPPVYKSPDLYKKLLLDNRQRDKETKRTNEGIHKSDLRLFYYTKNIDAQFCSTGEQKLFLISLTLLRAFMCIDMAKASPIILLDEVFSYLDNKRKTNLLNELKKLKIQTFITATDIAIFEGLIDKNINVIGL
jgi:very-short-patch-repair endonuclease